jgi:hypothetical protein
MNSRNPINGATYLTLGILSLVLCPFLGPIAWSMSNTALGVLDQYEPQTGDTSQRGLVVAGRICGIIGTVFFLLGLCVFLLRSCASAGPSSSSLNEPTTTVTIDGHPASPDEQRAIEEQIKRIDTHPSSPPSSAHSPK